jgi:hypothetical protein
MYGQYQSAVTPVTDGNHAELTVTTDRRLRVDSVSGSAPVGGGITWGAPTAVAMTGASKNLIAANAARKGIIFWNPTGNSPAAYSLSGSVVTLASGIPLVAGATPTVLTGAECPVGAITVIGTNTENLYYSEGT